MHIPFSPRHRGGRQLIAATTIALSGLSLAACSSDSGSTEGSGAVVGFYPLEFVTSSITGDKMDVESLAQPGAEPHDMELTAKQVGSLTDAKVVVYEKGMQPSLDDAIANEQPDNVVDVSSLATLSAGEDEAHEHADESAEDEHDHAEEDHDHASESGLDPHIWLDPQLMVKTATAVKDKLVEVDADNTDTYEKNYEDLKSKLEDLDSSFKTGLAQCQRTSIVTAHTAFGYLAQAYDLEQVGIAGLTDDEPSPQKLAEVKQFVETSGVTTIFFEEAASDKYAQTIADETGAQVAVLNPLENKPESGDYISAMQANLDELRAALGCS